MRIVVVSDAHGHINPVEKAIEQSNPDVLIYCGDGTNRIEDISYIYPGIRFYFVKGNCDFGDYPIEQEIKVGSKTVFFTHGHKYYVKMGYQKIIEEGKRRKADIVLFGHTHEAYTDYIDGMYIMNPGSCVHPNQGRPSYGFVDIVGKSIVTNIVYF